VLAEAALGPVKGLSPIARKKHEHQDAMNGPLTLNTPVGKYCGASSGGMELPEQLLV